MNIIEENKSFVICPICNTSYRELGQHIKIHKLDKSSFSLLYPSTPLSCLDVLELKSKGLHKSIETSNNKRQNRISKYYENPKLCKQCQTILPYDDKNKQFCNSSCSGTHTGLHRTHPDEIKLKIKTSVKTYHESEESIIGKYSKLRYVYCKICHKLSCIREDHRKYNLNICSDKCLHTIRSELGKKLAKHNDGHSPYKKKKYVSNIYGEIFLDSTWEYKLLKVLEINYIYWTKPAPIPWIDSRNNKTKLYYPDFYIPAWNLYLETKNSWLYKRRDKYKMEYILQHIPNIILILDSPFISLETLLGYIEIKDKNKSLIINYT